APRPAPCPVLPPRRQARTRDGRVLRHRPRIRRRPRTGGGRGHAGRPSGGGTGGGGRGHPDRGRPGHGASPRRDRPRRDGGAGGGAGAVRRAGERRGPRPALARARHRSRRFRRDDEPQPPCGLFPDAGGRTWPHRLGP
ncbi:MAG: Gluconate 5-dehydrogenase, partial [uncultured Rubellimicrobium sp.]